MRKPLVVVMAGLVFGSPLVGCRREPVAVAPVGYVCPMHPAFTSPRQVPCGLCGMSLVLQKPPAAAASSVTLEPSLAQQAGIRTAVVSRRPLKKTVRVTGRVVRDLYLGAALAEFQSLRSLPENNPASPSFESPASLDLRTRFQSTRQRLTQLGIDDESVLDQSLPAIAPQDPATYQWVYADLFADDFRWIRSGQWATVSASQSPEVSRAMVICLDAGFDKDTHAGRARLLIPQKARDLKPEMLVTVTFEVPLDARIRVPSDAVVYNGRQAIVFIKGEGQTYHARPVTLGEESNGYIQITQGVSEGETLVISPSFLLASELKLRGAPTP